MGPDERLSLGNDFVDQADPVCLVRIDLPAGDDQLHRLGEPHNQW